MAIKTRPVDSGSKSSAGYTGLREGANEVLGWLRGSWERVRLRDV